MKIIDLLKETYNALRSNKVRTFLTTLGIIIGISSVIIMTAVGSGAQSSIESSIQSIGANLIIIYPGAQRGPGVSISQGRGSAKSLTFGDVESLENLSNIEAIAPEISNRYQVVAKGTNTNTNIIGTMPSYLKVRNIEVLDGNFFTDQNNQSGSKVAVLGPTTRDDLFGEGEDVLGKIIKIKGIQFKIIGVTKAKGGSGFQNPDDVIYIPINTASRYFSGDEYVSSISISAINGDVTKDVQNEITDILLERHNIKDSTSADFSTLNQADIIATATSVTGTFTILLALVAGISLLVGGIGIMNMMLTTVTERTREIGLRKAIGARQRDISRQFLIEAIVLTFSGGFIGVVLGWLISFSISKLGIITTKVSIGSVLLAFFVSVAIGIIFGYYPARRAAKLNPIDALRYE